MTRTSTWAGTEVRVGVAAQLLRLVKDFSRLAALWPESCRLDDDLSSFGVFTYAFVSVCACLCVCVIAGYCICRRARSYVYASVDGAHCKTPIREKTIIEYH